MIKKIANNKGCKRLSPVLFKIADAKIQTFLRRLCEYSLSFAKSSNRKILSLKDIESALQLNGFVLEKLPQDQPMTAENSPQSEIST